MAESAARWVDAVVPEVPMRQWVLSLPFALRIALAYHPALCTAVLGVFVRTLLGALHRRARHELGIQDGRTGAITVIQRFGSALNLNWASCCCALSSIRIHSKSVGWRSERTPWRATLPVFLTRSRML